MYIVVLDGLFRERMIKMLNFLSSYAAVRMKSSCKFLSLPRRCRGIVNKSRKDEMEGEAITCLFILAS